MIALPRNAGRGLRAVAVLFLVAHGFAHLVGFAGSWRLGEFRDNPYSTLVANGAFDVGDAGMRLVGVLWVVAAGATVGAAIALWRGSLRLVAALTAVSLVVCLIGLPASIVGLWIDVAILAALVVVAALGTDRPPHRWKEHS